MKYVLFDFDGTIADSKIVMLSAWNKLAEKHHFKKIKIEELSTLKKLSIKERSKLVNFPMYKLPIIIPHLYKLYQQSIKEVNLYVGMREVFEELEKKGYKIVIISSNSRENILEFLRYNKIENIESVLCSTLIYRKDKLMNKFLSEKKLSNSEVIYIGDEHRDLVACKKTGIKMIWVGWGYDSFEVVQDEEPDYIVNTPSEILEVIF